MPPIHTHVRCPKCTWRPDGASHWACNCGHSWDVFATQGRCPTCQSRQESTFCPECCIASPHLHWYEGYHDALDDLLAEEEIPLWLRHGDVR